MNKITIKHFFFLFLFLGLSYFLFFKKPFYKIEVERIEPNAYQQKLYKIWTMYYYDYLEAIQQQESLFPHRNAWSHDILMKELAELRMDSKSTSIPISDSIVKKGIWRFCTKNWFGRTDTIIQIEINCVLGKMEYDNHSAWIVKRLETVRKYSDEFEIFLFPFFKYDIDDNNEVYTEFPINLNIRKKSNYSIYLPFFGFKWETGRFYSSGRIHDANLGYDDFDKTKILCFDKSESNIYNLHSYYPNGLVQIEGEFFDTCESKFTK